MSLVSILQKAPVANSGSCQALIGHRSWYKLALALPLTAKPHSRVPDYGYGFRDEKASHLESQLAFSVDKMVQQNR